MKPVKERRIFIVDDDPIFNKTLADHLRNNPQNEVLSFTSGEECLREFYKNPDLVILDYNLNNIEKSAEDGLRILERIKARDENISVLVLSGQSHYGIALQTVSRGAMEYLLKDTSSFQEIDEVLEQLP